MMNEEEDKEPTYEEMYGDDWEEIRKDFENIWDIPEKEDTELEKLTPLPSLDEVLKEYYEELKNYTLFWMDLYYRICQDSLNRVNGTKILPVQAEVMYNPQLLKKAEIAGLLKKVDNRYHLTSKGEELAIELIKGVSEIFMGNHPEYRELFKKFRPDRFK